MIKRKTIWFVIACSMLVIATASSVCGAENKNASCCDSPATPSEFSANYDLFTNFGQYMARRNCLRTAEGSPDWFWVGALIVFNVIVVSGYAKIFLFWRRCFLQEAPCDRDNKLMELAWIFALCAFCGYGISTVIFFWPVYRLQAIALVGLSIITWRFALNLEPFRRSFTSRRLQRELNESLANDNRALTLQKQKLAVANSRLEEKTEDLKALNEDLDEFVYAASHDLKAPLRAIDSLSQFIVEDARDQLPEQSRADLIELRGRVTRMERLLDGLLDYSRSRTNNALAVTIELSSLTQDAIDVLDVPKSFSVNNRIENITLLSPAPPLEQVIRNLIDNAIKHHHLETGTIDISARIDGNFAMISVADDGPGIAPEFQDRIFEMFQTIKRRDELDSNGMGLSLVKRLIKSAGGEILVDSEAGQGATFAFTWPLDASDLCISRNRTQHEPQTVLRKPFSQAKFVATSCVTN